MGRRGDFVGNLGALLGRLGALVGRYGTIPCQSGEPFVPLCAFSDRRTCESASLLQKYGVNGLFVLPLGPLEAS